MSDLDIINLLISRDEQATHDFFHVRCHNLIISIIRQVFGNSVDEDECINELYLYLMDNDAARLRQFQGRSTLLQWLKVTAIRYFLKRRDGLPIDVSREQEMPIPDSEEGDTDERVAAKMDIERLLGMVGNARYAYVIHRIMLEEASPEEVADELGVRVSNLYNIKKRAMERLSIVAFKDKERYGKRY